MKTFLQAEWRKLAMANYAVNPRILEKHLPHNTEIDFWQNTCYVSLVGFMFLNTKVKGITIPYHTHFEEVNLRFYVRYKNAGTWKRGVVFIKEIVPKPAISLVANILYSENYETMRMSHEWMAKGDSLKVEYKWKKGRWNSFSVEAENKETEIERGSEEEFITEHFWGYTKIGKTATSEYEVAHPRWNVYNVKKYSIDVNFAQVYGAEFGFLQQLSPKSVFLAEGSPIEVKHGTSI